MLFISHRGNITGPNPKKENRADYLFEALNQGFEIEIDVWYEDKQWYLGHDKPQWKTGTTIFKNAWCHAKNRQAFEELKKLSPVHYFWHENDAYTLTSLNMVWCKVGSPLIPNSICVLPEQGYEGDITQCRGICSDYIADWKKKSHE